MSTVPGRKPETVVPEKVEPEDVITIRPEETFEAFYVRELPRLVAFAAVLSGSAAAEDIAQEAMLAACRQWETVSRLDLPAAWVRRVCANRAVSAVRRRSVEARALLRLGMAREGPVPLADEHEVFWAETRRLPRRQAQAIALYYIYDMSVADVAASLGCSEGSVKVHLSRGRAALARRLTRTDEELLMSIDELGRAAATAARQRAAETVAPGAGLASLHRARRARSVAMVVAVTVSLVGVTVLGAVLLTDGSAASHDVPPAASIRPTLPATDPTCTNPLVTCLGGGRYRVALEVPVTVTVPADFGGEIRTFGTRTLEDYRDDADQTGITVFENATPAKNGSLWIPDPAAGTTARSMATWLLDRPFLRHASMKQVVVGDLVGWRVVAELKKDAKLRASKGDLRIAPTFFDNAGNAGYGTDLKGDYTLVDVPGAGVTVIWSWTLQPDRGVLAANQPYVDGLSFG